jgi:hypothetical protein
MDPPEKWPLCADREYVVYLAAAAAKKRREK